jgi:hypothetical protein
MDLSSLIAHLARYPPQEMAVVFGERRLTGASWASAPTGSRRSFPRNAAGKTLKRELREPSWAGKDRKI